ncbi:MAG: hypothetical protein Q7R35_20205 [Elusimicrobiota bacterium]|nr:hypothetical protein [Elusimicrobiota bacterium]
MKKAALILLALSLAANWQRAEAVGGMSGGSMSVARWAGNSQGQVSSAGGFSLNTSIGEAAFSSVSAGGYSVDPGYIKLAAQPGSVVSITAVTKSTGTLELAWLAPGADGFLGGVPNGLYRLDYSSDPAHSFKPTVFKTEFSTSVVPGDAQQLNIAGLVPNTTYYAKIYLGDAGKVIAGNSALGAESTLSDLPVNPVFYSVTPCNVTIRWTLPPNGAEGYRTDSSTTSFGILSPGGDVRTVSTPNGLQVSLSINGLAAATQYYFRVASLNWQGDRNFTTLIATTTAAGTCMPPVTGLAAAGNALSRAVTLTWVNPDSYSPEGVVVMLSTSPDSAQVANGTELTAGQILADGSVVKSTGVAVSMRDTGLTLDTTFFYHLMTKFAGAIYSVGVSTSVFLDLPPMAPAGLTAVMNPGRTAVSLTWNAVTSNTDGSAFGAPALPRDVELSHYRVEKSSSVGAPNWVAVATLPVSAQSFTEAVDPAGPAYIYRISAIDSLGTAETAMCVDTDQGIYVFSPNQVARLKIPADLGRELLAENNTTGSGILIRGVDEGNDPAKNIFNSVRFEAVTTPGNQVLKDFKFSRPELTVAVRYEVSGSQITPSAISPQGPISAGDAAQRLGLYWNNGEKYVKLYGKVDMVNQLVGVQTALLGDYQVRAVYRDAGVHFDISGLTNRAITPNGDGLNDTAVFTFDNPRDSAFSGKIFDLGGAFIANMAPGPVLNNSLQWDGKAGGRAVSGGAYVYQIRSEDKMFNGTLLVVR